MEIHKNQAKVIIEGLPPGILLHSPSGLGEKSGGKSVIPPPAEEAKSYLYWTEDGKSIAFPALNLQRAIIEAATGWKAPLKKKLSLGPILAGDMSIEPFMIPFNTTKYQIDSRRVVIQRQGIIRSRPLLYPWRLEFVVCWESQFLGRAEFVEIILPDLLSQTGHAVGIGDFRPKKSKGPFGRFNVVSIKAITKY